MTEPIIVFAAGTKDGGGSGFGQLAKFAACSGAGYHICAVVSNHEQGGVWQRARDLGIPFEYFPAPWTAERYLEIKAKHGARWVALSGWLKFVLGFDPAWTINIHPALLSFQHGRFGGKGLYGHRVHEAVHDALVKGELDQKMVDKNGIPHIATYSGFTMHFVTERFDDPAAVFAEVAVPISHDMSPDDIQKAVGKAEHMWQPLLTDMVVTGKIRFEKGKVIVPTGFAVHAP